MKVVILAGGMGTRLSEETVLKPKPMVEIGKRPILWHIMKSYSYYGFNDFIICLGYKGYAIKEFFSNYRMHMSDITIDMRSGTMEVAHNEVEPWRVTLVDTGESTMTGGRIKRIEKLVGDDTFLLTYGDGLADVDISALVEFHRSMGRSATVTAVRPPGRFGALEVGKDSMVTSFREKPLGDGFYINGGFFALEPKVFDYIKGDATIWEREPLESLTRDGQLACYKHDGFWYAMDTLREKNHLESLWSSGVAPWKKW
ncbi:MAG: glucose-1-phosphate cytidylyltransferase [Methanomassiliicoccus sp.]|nr:glucose-1-phosphate cytidylyltransferase [Methanomassiliicoccus sp.]